MHEKYTKIVIFQAANARIIEAETLAERERIGRVRAERELSRGGDNNKAAVKDDNQGQEDDKLERLHFCSFLLHFCSFLLHF